MYQLRKSESRGHANHGWLDSYHSFSFADYYDPQHMGFRSLRVINQDWIEGGAGFPQHPHKDMEIITYVTDGVLAHQDTLGNSTLIQPGDVQRMTAGTGIRHSEFNHLKNQPTTLLQIWILPNRAGLAPSYEQKSFSDRFKNEKFVLVASPDSRDQSILIHQDALLYVGRLEAGGIVPYEFSYGRGVWIQMVKGAIQVGQHQLRAGDALAIELESRFSIEARENSEFLLFDLA